MCRSLIIDQMDLDLQDYRAKLDVLREDNENLLKQVTIDFFNYSIHQFFYLE